MPELHTTYSEALWNTNSRRRHLLLGNGFSIGVHKAFGYPSLHAEAVNNDPSLARLFPASDSTNFEVALKAASNPSDAARIRTALIRAVAAVHPEHSLRLGEDECQSCRDFLEAFVGRERHPRGTIFTTNYDLLLHWVLSRQGKTPGTKQRTQLKSWDGFSEPGYWNPDADSDAYYLHGAVHIFQHPSSRIPGGVYTKMLRYEWGRTLKKQVEAQLLAGNLPAFIAEGDSQRKKAAQRQWEYLRRAKRKFKAVCNEGSASLFTFGHSFGESDDHLVEEIGKGAIGEVFIGAFSAKGHRRAAELADLWKDMRSQAGAPPVACVTSPQKNAGSGIGTKLPRRRVRRGVHILAGDLTAALAGHRPGSCTPVRPVASGVLRSLMQ